MYSFFGKKVLLMGLGGFAKGSGVSSAEFLASHGADLIITDLKNKKRLAGNLQALKKYKKIKYVLGGHYESDFEIADWIVRNPDVPPSSKFLAIARRRGLPIDNDVTLFFREQGVENVIGVTGTRGKSTTASLIYEMVKRQYPGAKLGGNIGESPLRFLMDKRKEKKRNPVILELSNFQLSDLDTIKMSPHVAVWTNLYPDHLNKYPSIKEYIADKEKIFKYQQAGDVAILNWDNSVTRKIGQKLSKTKRKVWWFSLQEKIKNGAYIKNGWFIFVEQDRETQVCQVKEMKIRGEHNQANILAAICAARGCGVSWQAIKLAIREFKGVSNRQEVVRKIKGVTFINDCTATSPQATIAALKSFTEKKIILISGGNSKGSSLIEMAKLIGQKVKALIMLPGNANEEILKNMQGVSVIPTPSTSLRVNSVEGSLKLKRKRFLDFARNDKIKLVQNLNQAVKQALKISEKGDFIILSPGLTWLPRQNEFARGEEFKKIVKNIL